MLAASERSADSFGGGKRSNAPNLNFSSDSIDKETTTTPRIGVVDVPRPISMLPLSQHSDREPPEKNFTFSRLKMPAEVGIETGPLSPELVEKAEKELRETPERRRESMEELKKLLKEDGTVHFRTDEDILLRYLRPTKFYPESAIALMKREAEFKAKHRDILGDLMPENLEEVLLNENVINVFANRDHMGRRVLLHRAGKAWDTSKVTSDQVFQMFYLIHQGALMEPATQVNGVVVILDFDGLGMSQVLALNPTFSLRLLSFIQDAMPLRMKEVHIVNQPWLFNMVWKLFKPLVKEKLNKRLHFHGTKLQQLHKFIPKEYLPADYGGSLPKMDYSSRDWYPILRSLDDNIRENNTFGLAKKQRD